MDQQQPLQVEDPVDVLAREMLTLLLIRDNTKCEQRAKVCSRSDFSDVISEKKYEHWLMTTDI